jgi:hypothetical protein
MRRQRATYEPRGCPLRPAASRSASLSPEPLALKKKAQCQLPCLLVLAYAATPWAAGRMPRAVGRPGSPATPVHVPQGLGESPFGTRIARVRCSTKPN